jgi:hypothetical protein
VDDGLERAIVPRTDEIDQALVALRAEYRLAGQAGGLDQFARRQRLLPFAHGTHIKQGP